MMRYPILVQNGTTQVLASYEEVIEQTIRARLLATQGTVAGNRLYGSQVSACLYEPVRAVAMARVLYHTRAALRGEERITVLRLSLDVNTHGVLITVTYRIIALNKTITNNFSV